MYSTKIIADSISPTGKRITTFELTYPRFVHAELLTHKMLSRNSASSRAIPVKKMLDQIRNDPAEPVFWGKNEPGMQASKEFEGAEKEEIRQLWLEARDSAVRFAEKLMELNVHKQLANRITEPWMFITVLVTATEYDNWYKLRDSEFAQPEIAWVARDMRRAHGESKPQELSIGQWHTPLVSIDEVAEIRRAYFEDPYQFSRDTVPVGPYRDSNAEMADGLINMISAGRCARVSYLTHDGKRDWNEDLKLAARLATSGHWSPFEHVAQALNDPDFRNGNFIGWKQLRSELDPNFVRIQCPSCRHTF